MAEKRFVCIEKGEGKYCQFYSEWYDECSFYMDRKGTEHCRNCKKGFTRTEAIERMAKAVIKKVLEMTGKIMEPYIGICIKI